MLILKVGGSVFAPKNNNLFDISYLKTLNAILKESYKGRLILVHGTGNIGHGFVKKYGISKKTYQRFVGVRKSFFHRMNSIFCHYKRIVGKKVFKVQPFKLKKYRRVIIGGDIDSRSLSILSSDDIFAKCMNDSLSACGIIMTDVDGVLDENGKLVTTLYTDTIDTIHFWSKEGDMTNSMKGKLMALQGGINNLGKHIWIINGFNLKNLEQILRTGEGIGTKVFLKKES